MLKLKLPRVAWGPIWILGLALLCAVAGCGLNSNDGETVRNINILQVSDIKKYENVTRVFEDVFIADLVWPDIEEARAIILPNLTTVEGDFVFDVDYDFFLPYGTKTGSSTRSIQFPALQTIGGTLRIANSPYLESLKGFSRLRELGGSLVILGCASLTGMEGLEGLTQIPGSLVLGGNVSMTSYEGLSNVKTIGFGGQDHDTIEIIRWITEGHDLLEFSRQILNVEYGNVLIAYDGGIQLFGELAVTSVAGSVGFTGDVGPLIGLNRLEYVGKTLAFGWTTLESLDGLQALQHVSQLEFAGNKELVDIGALDRLTRLESLVINSGGPHNFEGLHNVTEVVKGIDIKDSVTDLSPLRSLTLLGGLRQVRGTIRLTGLSKLVAIGSGGLTFMDTHVSSFLGLENVVQILGPLYVSEVTVPLSFAGLDSLEFIGGGVTVVSNAALRDFEGMNRVVNIDGGFVVQSNGTMESFDGLESLNSIEGGLSILDNPALSDILGLSAVYGSAIQAFEIAYNKELCTTDAQELSTRIGATTASIWGNKEC